MLLNWIADFISHKLLLQLYRLKKKTNFNLFLTRKRHKDESYLEKNSGDILSAANSSRARTIMTSERRETRNCFSLRNTRICGVNEISTLHSCRLIASRLGQLRAKHITALSVSWRHPLLKKLRSSGHPLASASTPLSVSSSHHERLMWVSSGQPAARSFRDMSVISGHESRFSRWSLGQWLLRAAHVASEILLHWLRLSSSILGHDWARARIELLPMLWHPLSESCLRNPPQRLEIFSITGPYAQTSLAIIRVNRDSKVAGDQRIRLSRDYRPSVSIYLHVSLKIEEIDPLPIGSIER